MKQWPVPKPECMENGKDPRPKGPAISPGDGLTSWPYLLYNLALYSPLPFAYLLWRSVSRGHARHGWAQRLGWLPSQVQEFCRTHRILWIHAVSVGEVVATLPLLRELRGLNPNHHILLSTTTETGRTVAAARACDAAALIYFPFDWPGAVRRALQAVRPELFVAVDTELWPNFFRVAYEMGVATATANGRISDKAFRRIRRCGGRALYRQVFRHIDRLCMQSARDAERVRELGAVNGQVWVTGNSKFDEDYPEVSADEQVRMKTDLGIAREAPVFLAGSTGEGEEPHVLAAFQRVRARYPEARLILVPRHIQRTPEIEGYVREAGLKSVRRTQLPAQAGRSQSERCVVIVDTLGELARLYAVATVAFVGRSLVPQGGSNVLQAAAQGKPVLFGPNVNNVRDSAELLLHHHVAWQIPDSEALAAQVCALLANPAGLAHLNSTARAVIAANRGSARRTAEVLTELLTRQGT